MAANDELKIKTRPKLSLREQTRVKNLRMYQTNPSLGKNYGMTDPEIRKYLINK